MNPMARNELAVCSSVTMAGTGRIKFYGQGLEKTMNSSNGLHDSYSDQQMKYPNHHQRRSKGRWLPFVIAGLVLFAFLLMFVSIREDRARAHAVQVLETTQRAMATRDISQSTRQAFLDWRGSSDL